MRRSNLNFSNGDSFDAWYKVESIEPDTMEGASLVDGVMVPYKRHGLQVGLSSPKVYGGGLTLCCQSPDATIRIAMTKEQKAETMAQALAYQANLTKTGTPRKRKTNPEKRQKVS